MAKLSDLLLQSLVVRQALPVCHVPQLALGWVSTSAQYCCCEQALTMLAGFGGEKLQIFHVCVFYSSPPVACVEIERSARGKFE